MSASGTYWVNSKDGLCDDNDTIVIKALTTPTLKPSRDTVLCGGSYLKFNIKKSGPLKYGPL